MKTSLHHLKSTTGAKYLLIVTLTLAFAAGTLTSNAQCSLTPNFVSTIYTPSGVNNPRGLCSGDFNNDGKLDWAVCMQNGSKVSVYLNNGTGGFTEAPGSGFSTPGNNIAIATGDFNGDGILDLAVSSENSPNVSVFLGNGNGSFGSALNLTMVGNNNRTVVVADLNHDGFADIAATSSSASGGTVSVFLSNGDGTFQTRADYSDGNALGKGMLSAFTGDFDNDGNLDIAYASENGDNVAVVFGNGLGGFGSPVVLTPLSPNGSSSMTGITIGDFDGNGKPDIAATNSNNAYVDVWLNTGSRTFTNHTHYAIPGNAYQVVSADFNNDGKIDLATINTNNTMTILLGNGDGTFATNENFTIGSANNSYMITADFNNDGRPDIVESNEGSNNIYVWLNTTVGASAIAGSPVCPGGTISLTGTGPAGTTSYNWSGPNSFTSSVQNPTISSANTANAGVYNLVVTTSGGCTDYASTPPVVITVASASASATTLCSGGTLRLTGGPATMKTYSWSGPGGYTSTLQNPTITNPAVATGAYSLTVTDVNACSSTASTASVTVNATPAAGTISGPTIVCGGQTGVVYSTSIPNASSYSWTVAPSLGTISGSSVGSSILVNILASPTTGNISVVGVSSTCGTGTSSSVTVSAGVPAVITGGQTITCLGGTTPLSVSNTATVTGASAYSVTTTGNYTVYSFTSAGTTTGTSKGTTTTSNYTFTPSANMTVQYLVIGGGGGSGNASNGVSGGGGAGGYRCSVPGEFSGGLSTAETPLALTGGTSYSVQVGGGGTPAVQGASSIFASITSIGGGYGGYYNGANGGNGGSGGGGGQSNGCNYSSAGSATFSYEGFNGGSYAPFACNDMFCGAGGGGAGGVGKNAFQDSLTWSCIVSSGWTAISTDGGPGGSGIQSNITGTSTYRGGGGGGGSHNMGNVGPALGGTGGGGNGKFGQNSTHSCGLVPADLVFATAGVDGTGGGGGGGGDNGATGGVNGNTNGGSGIVIVRFLNPTGGTWASDNTTVATVDNSGVVTGVAAGTANITYSYTPSGSTCELASSNYSVTVTNSTTATATASATSLCSTGSLTLTGSSNVGAGATYTWAGPNSYSSTLQSPVITNPAPFTSSAYTLTVVNTVCSTTATATTAAVTVTPVASAAGAISGSAIVCANSSFVYSVAPIANATSYLWTVPGSLGTGSSTSNSITIVTGASPVAGTISVAGVSAAPCANGTSSSLPITVNTLTAATTISSSGGASVCPGQTGVVYSAAPLSGAATYVWSIPSTLGTISGSSTGSSVTVNIAAAGTATSGNITVKGVNTCGTAGTVSPSFAVTVPSTAISGNTLITCIGATSQLSAPPVPAATGGTITTFGSFVIHTFNASGTFTPTSTLSNVQYLVIGGGGGGGNGSPGNGGGGGAGGYRTSVPGDTSGGGSNAESPISSLTSGVAVAVTIGTGGGGGGYGGTGGSGGSSSFGSYVTSAGGGGGGSYNGVSGAAGASGGGGGQTYHTNGGTATPANQGFPGGGNGSPNGYGAGAGGGAGGPGGASFSTNGREGGNGGRGLKSFITGTGVWRGGGGGGSSHGSGILGVPLASDSGIGGGGTGHYVVNGSSPTINPTNGRANTGGGGGGSGESASTTGVGGSGIVIVRYSNPTLGTWTSDNTAVVTVDNTGLVTAVSSGTANISFTPTSGSCTYTTVVPVTVNTSAFVVTATATPSSVCAGGSNNKITLTGSGTGATNYSWAGPNGFVSTSSTAIITNPTTAAAGVYTLTASSGSCSGSTTTSAVVVNPLVTAQGAIGGPTVVCQNTTVVYSTTTIANAAGYSWTVPSTLGTISGASNGTSISVTIPGGAVSGNITVAGVPAGGCDNGPASAAYAVGVNTTLPASSGISTTNGAVICSSETGIVYSAAAITGATSYQWSVPASVGTIIGASTNNSITVTTAASPTGGTITVAGINACGTVGASTPYAVGGPTPATLTGGGTITCIGSTQQLSVPSAIVSAGTITTHSGGYVVQTFTASGSTTGVSTGTTTASTTYTFTPQTNMTVQYLVIAGGGGGGIGNGDPGNSGGGGAGGYRCSVPGELTGGGGSAESPLSLTAGVPVNVVVGGGGMQTTQGNGLGNNSSFGSITATGGGYGGVWQGNLTPGGAGGSGGGAGQSGSLVTVGGAVTPTQGFPGAQITPGSGACGGSGGGGAGEAGHVNTITNSVPVEGGPGGAGLTSSITGSPVTRGGGGGGSSHGNGILGVAGGASVGGAGGGGNGHYNTGGVGPAVAATNGVDGTGGGGGGGGETSAAPGIGGAGIIIVRYPDISGGTWSSSNTVVATVNSSSGLVTAHANGSTTISYTYTPSNSNCSLTSTLPLTVTSLTASAGGSTPVCSSGTNSMLTLNGSTNAVVPSYSWSGPNGFSSTAQNPSISGPSTAASGVYTLTAIDGTCSTTSTTAIVVNLSPATSQSITKCAGESVTVGNITHRSSGTYMDKLTAANGCDSVVTTKLSIIFGTGVPATFTNPSINYGTGSNAHGVTTGDFNNDGITDFATCNYYGGNVSVYLGTGTGAFVQAPGSPLSSGSYYCVSIFTGDFDGDGNLDIVCTDDASISIFFGNGNAGFTAPTVLALPGTAGFAVSSGDYNHDGITDIAACSAAASKISVFLSNGSNRTFQPRSDYSMGITAGGGPIAMAGGDFNGDGNLDYALANHGSDNVSVVYGNSTGGFSTIAPLVLTPPATVGQIEGIAVADFNGDGKMDIVAGNYTTSNLVVWLGNGAGAFPTVNQYSTGANTNPYGVVAGDFNGDGKIDIASDNATSNNITVLYGNGAGSFASLTAYPVQSGGSPQFLAVGDFNGDGKPDFVTANGASTASVILNTVPLVPTPLVVSPSAAVCTGATNVALTASGASSYTWLPATNLTPSAGTSAIETAQVSQLTFYTVTGTATNGCTTNVIVPVATVATGGQISPAYSIICSGGTKTLTVLGAAGHDYQWQISTDDVNWTNITGATNTTYTTAGSDGNSNKFYRLMAQSNSCWNVASTTGEVDISNSSIAVSVTNITDNSLTLNWSPTGTGNYSVSYSGPTSATSTSVTSPKTITGLTSDGTYSITVTQTGVSGCAASGTITGINTLCAMPTGVTLSSPAPSQIQVSWTGVAGADYRVYYRPLFSYNTYFTKDVSNASGVLLTKQGANNIYASTTYEVYVSRLDCPTTGAVGQGTNPTNVTTLPTVTCATPVIDSVRSLCPVQIEVFIHDNGVNQYSVFIQRITPSILAVNSYGVSGTYFTINTPYSGDQYLIALEAKCGSALSSVYVYPGNVTVKPLCSGPTNLVLSNPTCHGFTASWNSDECLSNSASAYDFYLRVAGTINYNSYGVSLPSTGIGPHDLLNFLAAGRTYQVFVRSVYNCNGFVTYGPSSQVETITTLSSGCRDEDAEQPQENKPATQQYAPDNSEVFSLYPNPNTGKFVVDLSRLSMEEDAVRIEVINMLGQTVLTHLTSIGGGHMSEYINLPGGTAAGTYIVRLTAGKNVYTAKINVSK